MTSRTLLGEVVRFQNGGTPSKAIPAFFEGKIPWITGADIIGPVAGSARSFITEDAVLKSAVNIVPAGTVLLVTRTSVGKVAIAGGRLGFSQDITALTPDARQLDASYLVHFLRSKQIDMVSQARGATIKGITREVVASLEIPLLSLDEQRRIAAILDQADALRAKRVEALAHLGDLTRSVFLSLFAADDQHAVTIRQLIENRVLLLHKDGNHGSLYPRHEDFGSEGIPFVSAKALTDLGAIDHLRVDRLTESAAAKLRIGWIQNGDVLLAHNASVGKVALYDGSLGSALIGTSLTAFRPNPEALDSSYLAAALAADDFQRQLQKNMSQTTRNQVPITAQKELRIAIPPLALQKTYAKKAQGVEQLKSTYADQLLHLDRLFASLQSGAFGSGH
jgi:type I restriction enzyme, S subunit